MSVTITAKRGDNTNNTVALEGQTLNLTGGLPLTVEFRGKVSGVADPTKYTVGLQKWDGVNGVWVDMMYGWKAGYDHSTCDAQGNYWGHYDLTEQEFGGSYVWLQASFRAIAHKWG